MQPPTQAPWAAGGSMGGAMGGFVPTGAPWAAGNANANLSAPAGMYLPRGARGPVPALIQAQPKWPDVVEDDFTFIPAVKRITSQESLAAFIASDSARKFVSFLLSLNDSVKGRELSTHCPIAPPVARLLEILEEMEQWITEIPPSQQSLRYGNPAYRLYHARMLEKAVPMLCSLLPERYQTMDGPLQELLAYWTDSFGNSTRIDYGTGHEANFAAFLFCLARLGVLHPTDRPAIVLKVFHRYLRLMRTVQTTYWLEPAGSHGVWGLDDYQFLPFFWGSAQLVDHPYHRPSCIHDDMAVREGAPEYLYLEAVQFVKQVKRGNLAETSPLLNDISGVASWSKVNQGMVKMYQAELLNKQPIMQHFPFGNMLPFPEGGEAQYQPPQGGSAVTSPTATGSDSQVQGMRSPGPIEGAQGPGQAAKRPPPPPLFSAAPGPGSTAGGGTAGA